MSQVEGAHELSPEQQAFLAAELSLFCERAVKKFVRGQREHGGNFPFDCKRSFLSEIDGEIIDLFMYSRAVPLKLRNL